MTPTHDPEPPRPDVGGGPASQPVAKACDADEGADVAVASGTLVTLTVLISNFPDEASARDACTRLLEERLIACANLQAPCRSLYRWDGRTQDGTEIPVWVKTSAGCAERARRRLAELHPYDVPEILMLEPRAHAPYAAWVEGETAVWPNPDV